MELFIPLFFGVILAGFIGMGIGNLSEKRNGNIGFLLGALLGPIGWIIVALLPEARDADAPAPARPAADNSARIRALEAELAKMKAAQHPVKPLIRRQDPQDPDDGGIPVYKLD